MDTASLKNFATWARTALLREVTARMAAVLAPGAPERVEQPKAIAALEKAVSAAGGGDTGRAAVADKVAYTWFNRIIALRFMDANGYTGIGIVSPHAGVDVGQPEILAEAKRGVIDGDVVGQATRATVTALLDGTRTSSDPQGEAYALLLTAYCRYWNTTMPFMFERAGDFTELLIPANLLADDSVLNRSVTVLTEDVCKDVEVIGWLYQFYISERKSEVFAGFKKNKKAGAAEIPAATQLFTPHWIVRYLVENSLGRLWMLNRPSSRLVDRMEYYIAPVDEETDFLKITGPEELKIIDPACGSGHMLTYAFDLLYAIYEEEGYAPSEIPGLILKNNLYGTEIDPRAGALAAFALTMKARAKQRTFFTKRVEPNICVVEPIFFNPDELDILITEDGDKYAEGAFWNQFQHADELGSLIRPDMDQTARLKQHISQLEDDADLLSTNVIDRAQRVILQAEYLLPRYAVVIANPPYMGVKNMAAQLADFAKAQYPMTKSDLFSMFIERSSGLGLRFSMHALVTMQSWMFLPTYAPLRQWLATKSSITNLAHLDNMVMGIAFGTSATIWKVDDPHIRGSYIHVHLSDVELGRPKEFPPANDRNQGMIEGEGGYVLENSDFSRIPGRPIAYWVSEQIREVFSKGTRLDLIAEPRQGMATSDNARFLRYGFEVARNRVAFDCESRESASESGAKWFPYSKGGERRKWYGNHELIVNWERDGEELLDFAASLYGSASRTIKNTRYYFKPALTWSLTSSSGFAARYRPAGFIFDVNGMSSFSDTGLEEILGTVNSSVGSAILSVINPTMALQAGDLKSFPFIAPSDPNEFVKLVRECIQIAREDWDSQETSWDFAVNGVVSRAREKGKVQTAIESYLSYWEERTERLQTIETHINGLCAASYGLQGEVPKEVDISEINLVNNPAFRASSSTTGRDAEEVRDLVSFAVGCMFGRYGLDKPGLILADQGATMQDYFAKVPAPTFLPDADNVIPIVDGEWFEDDIVEQFRRFLRVAFGEQYFEENLRFISECLGVKNVRDYFITKSGRSKFYDDHVKRYKKRPIYWMFSSPKGSFNALIYMHRYTPSTVSTVLTYLREFQAKLKASLEHAERSNNAKEADRLRKVLLELDEYEHDVLYPLASQNIEIDLDDGVAVNYPKFGTALNKLGPR